MTQVLWLLLSRNIWFGKLQLLVTATDDPKLEGKETGDKPKLPEESRPQKSGAEKSLLMGLHSPDEDSVYATKKDAEGKVYQYHAQLVAHGRFSQVYQVDIKSVYLNGKFKGNKVIYMKPPPGMKLSDDPELVLCLLRPIYRL
ncbi:hypothetical protein OBBRIDRAFT_808866 [Obba rivulosa]|uniref:Reverse transcriptase n=1 Tax=Obba rivulosa TaxID=1052685 RepID=A0A8E2DE76_9APHY|nr:hypothetical protein OBBRIDRAFT_808866 [Obba rivulosa]